ncbi:hypothetical protein Ocin01_13501, partial [Orchesella cincta]
MYRIWYRIPKAFKNKVFTVSLNHGNFWNNWINWGIASSPCSSFRMSEDVLRSTEKRTLEQLPRKVGEKKGQGRRCVTND